VSQYPRTQLESTITEINGKCLAYSLSCPSSFQTYPLTNLFHLFGKKRHRYLSPWDKLIELIIFSNYFMRMTPLINKRIKLRIQITMNNKSSIVPMILTYSIQFHLHHQRIVIIRSRMKRLLHLTPLKKIVPRKLVIICFGRSTKCLR
jgi:hypothetical protein